VGVDHRLDPGLRLAVGGGLDIRTGELAVDRSGSERLSEVLAPSRRGLGGDRSEVVGRVFHTNRMAGGCIRSSVVVDSESRLLAAMFGNERASG